MKSLGNKSVNTKKAHTDNFILLILSNWLSSGFKHCLEFSPYIQVARKFESLLIHISGRQSGLENLYKAEKATKILQYQQI